MEAVLTTPGTEVKPAIGNRIAQIAKTYIGETELPQNSGFKDPAFAAKIKACGWVKGWAWCVFFCELVWKEAYGNKSRFFAILDRLFAPSAIGTHANFRGSKYFRTGAKPQIGAIAIYQHGYSGWQGHAALVVDIHDDGTYDTVEGNTSANPEDREGTCVKDKYKKRVGLPAKKDTLNLIGFIYPTEE